MATLSVNVPSLPQQVQTDLDAVKDLSPADQAVQLKTAADQAGVNADAAYNRAAALTQRVQDEGRDATPQDRQSAASALEVARLAEQAAVAAQIAANQAAVAIGRDAPFNVAENDSFRNTQIQGAEARLNGLTPNAVSLDAAKGAIAVARLDHVNAGDAITAQFLINNAGSLPNNSLTERDRATLDAYYGNHPERVPAKVMPGSYLDARQSGGSTPAPVTSKPTETFGASALPPGYVSGAGVDPQRLADAQRMLQNYSSLATGQGVNGNKVIPNDLYNRAQRTGLYSALIGDPNAALKPSAAKPIPGPYDPAKGPQITMDMVTPEMLTGIPTADFLKNLVDPAAFNAMRLALGSRPTPATSVGPQGVRAALAPDSLATTADATFIRNLAKQYGLPDPGAPQVATINALSHYDWGNDSRQVLKFPTGASVAFIMGELARDPTNARQILSTQLRGS